MSDAELSEAARAFAEGDVALLPSALSAADGDALVELLRARGDVTRLARLGDASDKALAKKARKALHLLRARGVTAEPQKREFRVVGPHAREELSLATAIDGRGERIVWLGRSSAGEAGGIDIFEAQLSDTRGILAFAAMRVARKEWRKHNEGVLADERMAAARIAEPHARALIEEAYRKTLAVGRTPPEEFARARLGLGHYEPETTHPSLVVAPPLPPADARGELPSLHALPELRLWIPPEEMLPELDLAIGDILTSKLVVDPAQRREQLAAAVDKLADKLLTPEYRQLLGGRLRETAYQLHQRGKLHEARLASTAAELTLDASVAGRDNPFVTRLFLKVVRAPELS
jgi:hypothetical protein